MLALTKHSCQQNIGDDKVLALTTYWHQQNTRVDKMLALTKCLRQQNTRVNKCTCAEATPYCFGPAESTAADFSQTTLMFSYFSQKVLIPPRAVTKLPLATLLLWANSLPQGTGLLYRLG
jgi:hypothetical protein